MGHPKRKKKRHERPRRPWVAQRIKEEKELAEKYGLKNKREIWKAASFIKRYRREVRAILAEIAGGKPTEHTLRKKEEILTSLRRRGILKAGVGMAMEMAVAEAESKPEPESKKEVETVVPSPGTSPDSDLGLEDVLALGTEDVLERRLQTQVHKKELSNSLKHARQLIVHGHIAINDRRVTIPSYMVSLDEERGIGYYGPAPIPTTAEEKGVVEEGTD
ncbi:MAG: 30S ribosomal protein S4 [Euryarchaeota archaeon]|nr:30S ribosomal protein S4 [Euryarchaeota archaeon]